MIRRGTNNKITSRHWVVVEILDVRRRVRRQKPGARPEPGLGDRCSADGRPGDRARVQGITDRERERDQCSEDRGVGDTCCKCCMFTLQTLQ